MKRSVKIAFCCISVCAAAGLVMVAIACFNNGTAWIYETFSFITEILSSGKPSSL